MRRRLAAALLPSIVLAMASCGHDKDRGASGDPDKVGGAQPAAQSADTGHVPVKTTLVRMGTVPVVVTAFGSVSGGANSQASLAFPEAGRISSVEVTVGEPVSKGQILAQLDTGPFEADAAQARAALAASQAAYDKTLGGASPQQQVQTSAQIQAAQMQMGVAQAQLSREQQLSTLGLASRADVDAAKGNVANARSQLEVLQQQRSLQHHPWSPDVAAASAGVQQAEATLSAAQQKLAYSALTAPFSGTIIARLHNEGETVDPSLPVIQIAGNDKPVFTAQFSPGDVQHIHVGDVAALQAQGVKGTVQGHVMAINPSQSTDAHTIPVIIGINATNVEFGPGAYGSATIRVGSLKGLVVPSSAIVKDPTTGSTQAFRKQGRGYAPVPVSIRAETNTIVLVETPGLHAGDRIVFRGAYELAVPGAAQAKTDPDTH